MNPLFPVLETGHRLCGVLPLANGLLSALTKIHLSQVRTTAAHASVQTESFAANKDLFLLLRELAEEKQAAPFIPPGVDALQKPGSFHSGNTKVLRLKKKTQRQPM